MMEGFAAVAVSSAPAFHISRPSPLPSAALVQTSELIRRVQRFQHAKKTCCIIKCVPAGRVAVVGRRQPMPYRRAHDGACLRLSPHCRYALDTRYSEECLSSHDRRMLPAIPARVLSDISAERLAE